MTTLRATAAAYGVQRPEARRTEVCMTNLIMQLSETVCDEPGTFHPRSNETDHDPRIGSARCAAGTRAGVGHTGTPGARREAQILADARRPRVNAIERIAFLRRRDADRISSLHTPKGTPLKNNTNAQRNAISGWEGEGGAVISDESSTGIVQSEKRAAEQDRRDASHQSDVRGEHRYPEAHQTVGEQTARRNRDDLKGRLAGRLAPGSARKLRRK
jgi:hypothetical protein